VLFGDKVAPRQNMAQSPQSAKLQRGLQLPDFCLNIRILIRTR
jgi:hypothetical protein